MNTKYLVAGVVFAVVVGFVGWFVPHVQAPAPVVQTVGAVGDYYSSPNSVSVQLDPSGVSYGYDSITNKYVWGGSGGLTNNSGRDRNITSIEYNCTGLNVTASTSSSPTTISLIAATSTTLASSTSIDGTKNTNYIVNNSTALATSTAWFTQPATSTPYGSVSSFASGVSRVWSNSSIFNVESNATTSASCWIKLNYIPQ